MVVYKVLIPQDIAEEGKAYLREREYKIKMGSGCEVKEIKFVQERDSNWRNHYKLTDEVEPQWKQVLNDCGDMSKAAEIIRCTGNDFAVLAGRDSLIYGFLAYGGHGNVAATANIVPRLVVSIYELYQKGEYQAALEAQFKLASLRMAFSLGSFPVIMKEALKLRGVDMGNTLKPIGSLDVKVREKLREILEEIDK